MDDTRIKIVALMGQSGSGKDTIKRTIFDMGLIPNAVPIISCTTRPKREYEVDGKDYHFITFDKFEEDLLNNNMIEAKIFNNWGYGTRLQDLDKNKINIGVYTPSGVYDLSENHDIDLCVIYVLAEDKTRMLRQLNREHYPDVHEIARRFLADEGDFDQENNIKPIIDNCFTSFYYLANNGENTIEDVAIEAAYIIGQNWLNH